MKVKQIWNAVTTILIALIVLLAALIWGVRLIGMDVLVVQSGSMEPEYPTGSLVYVKDADVAALEVGDVITFNLSPGVKGTHRIIEVVPDEEDPGVVRFRTKGDANEHPDNGLVEASDIFGQVVFCVPYLGYVINYIQQPSGTYMAIAVGALILLLTFLPDLIFNEEKEKKQ